jgi:hypothetical protein
VNSEDLEFFCGGCGCQDNDHLRYNKGGGSKRSIWPMCFSTVKLEPNAISDIPPPN